MNQTPAILEMAGVTRSFRDSMGRVDVLRGITLAIHEREFLIVTGPSGSGKSTLLNMIALLDKPDSGSILFQGRETTSLPDSATCALRAREIGMVFQKFHLLPYRSALDNVLFRWRYVQCCGSRGRSPSKPREESQDMEGERPREPFLTQTLQAGDSIRAAAEALSQVGLASVAHRPARLLSAGEMQRVAIARAMALPPKLLVADEPTGNLDKLSSAAVMDCFKKLNDSGMTIMMVTHNESLLAYGSRHLVCKDGVLAQP